MKKNIVKLFFVGLLILVGLGIYFYRQLPREPKTLADYLNSKKEAYATQLNLSAETLDKMVNKIIEIEDQLKINNKDYQNLVQVGVLYQRLHEFDSAKQKFEQAITALPGEGLAYANLAELYVFNYKDAKKAVENYKKAIENDYWRLDFYRSLADLYVSEFPDKINEVEPLMLLGVEKNSGHEIDYYSYLIDFFWQQDNLDKAIEYTKKCLVLNSSDSKYADILKQLQAEKLEKK